MPDAASVLVIARMLLATLAGCATLAGPVVLSDYGSLDGVNHQPRRGVHPGIDFGGARGDAVVAPMPGEVIDVSASPDSSGNCLVLAHARRARTLYTLYCHLDRVTVARGQRVARGGKLGELGASGAGAGGVVHLHYQLCTRPCTAASMDGDLDSTLDPAAFTVGCFESRRAYDDDRFELTYPLGC